MQLLELIGRSDSRRNVHMIRAFTKLSKIAASLKSWVDSVYYSFTQDFNMAPAASPWRMEGEEKEAKAVATQMSNNNLMLP